MTPLMLTGKTQKHLIQFDDKHLLHTQTVKDFSALQLAAKKAGFNLQIASSFRSFEQQLAIWNAKFTGLRPILDKNSEVISPSTLSADQKIEAILRWSALPGASRHHWGCDIDIFDPTLQNGQPLQLIPQEYQNSGTQAPLSHWLNENIHQYHFFMPYLNDNDGVCPEPWHISHAPVSLPALNALSHDIISKELIQSEIEGKAALLKKLPWIETQFIKNITSYSI